MEICFKHMDHMYVKNGRDREENRIHTERKSGKLNFQNRHNGRLYEPENASVERDETQGKRMK